MLDASDGVTVAKLLPPIGTNSPSGSRDTWTALPPKEPGVAEFEVQVALREPPCPVLLGEGVQVAEVREHYLALAIRREHVVRDALALSPLRTCLRPRSSQPRLGAGERRHGRVDDARGVMDSRTEPRPIDPHRTDGASITITPTRVKISCDAFAALSGPVA